MSLILNKATFQNSLATLPLVTYQAGETVIADGSRTGRLLILSKGTVAIVKEGTEIAKVAEPGAVFGELSVLLDQPHAADVRVLETSEFHVADATTLLTQNPIAVLYVATMLAHRLNGANHALIQLKQQSRPTWSPKRSVRWKDFWSPAPALCMRAIQTIHMHNQISAVAIGATHLGTPHPWG